MQKITPFLWFDKEASKAAKFYTSVFKGSKINSVSTMEDTPSGTVEIVNIELLGEEFTMMSAGPQFKFTEAVSFFVSVETQREVDYYWDKLTDGGEAGQCGWLKDKYGLSWQIIPTVLGEMLGDKDATKAGRTMQAMLQMKKIDIQKLKEAYEQN